MSLLRRALNVFRGHRVNEDLDDELAFHLEATIDQLVAEGLTVEAATLAARRRLGNRTSLRERSRDVKLLPWLEAIVGDVGFGVRMLRKNATATSAVVVSLGLAMGACTAAFMLVDALVFRELPVREPGRLIYLAMPPTSPSQTRESSSFSYPLFERFQAASVGRVDLVVAGYQARRRAVFPDAPDREDRLIPQHVSGNFFSTLGIVPAYGRVLTAADDRRETPARVAVLSHAFWKRRFGGDPSVIGSVFTLDREFQYEIVGVSREGFTGVEPGVLTDVWIPATTNRPDALTSPGQHWFRTWGRLAPGVTAEEVQQRLQPVMTQFRRERAATFPADAPADERARYINQPLVARSAAHGPSFLRLEFERPLWVMAAIVSLVLLLACSNVANLLLARAAARDREMALRLSIGAGRGRLVPAAPARKRTAGGRGMCAWRGHRAAGSAGHREVARPGAGAGPPGPSLQRRCGWFSGVTGGDHDGAVRAGAGPAGLGRLAHRRVEGDLGATRGACTFVAPAGSSADRVQPDGCVSGRPAPALLSARGQHRSGLRPGRPHPGRSGGRQSRRSPGGQARRNRPARRGCGPCRA
jgi:hypothetical protein